MKKITPKTIKSLVIAVCVFTFVISLFVIVFWLLNKQEMLSLIFGRVTMKFNTALSFLLHSICVLVYIKQSRFCKIINLTLISIVTVIAIVTLINYFFEIENFYVIDKSAINSPTTAIGLLFLGFAILGMQSKKERIKKRTQFVFIAILLVSFIVILSYILQIPIAKESSFINSMSLHTSLMFLLFSSILSVKNSPKEFYSLILSKYAGSKLIRLVAPYNFIMILLMSLALLYAVNHNIIGFNFGFIIFTIVALFVSILYIFGIAVGINKRDVEKENLKNSLYQANLELSQLKQALDDSSIVAATDVNGVITSVNDKFCEISKYSREELVGKTHKVINSGHHSRAFFKELWGTIKSGEVWIGGVKNKAKDGSFYWVHTSIIPFKNEKGEIYQFLTIRQDITRLTMLSSQYENLQLKNKEIEQFTYIASHDLQEPLRSIRGMVNILKQKQIDEIDVVTNNCISFIERSTDRMSSLIKGLLDYSRIGVNKELETVYIKELVDSIKMELSDTIKNTNAKIIFDNLPALKVYKKELHLLFFNLITNAIKFHKKDVDPIIKVSAIRSGQYWRFSVSDNGIGIENLNNRNIFGMFQKLNRRGNFDGTGIGLAHCDKIIHLHGGEIWVDSKLGEGSTFHFTIPINLN
ncbi:ATP-binding protein [Lutibacter sp. A64]|uniref:sensor histidine kinase n=1 Tax=Lutibacter sp. A64 TaxID=2918526 RepID=UPI001F06C28A|nr:PAS domain-containing sensor histidine kinase [Lutibacter sp. A64]UMB53103.1 ATP-binding protein [Lutibacter sp. A64]